MQTSDFIKGNSDAAPAYVNGGGRSQTTRVVIDGKEYCKKQLAQAYKDDLRRQADAFVDLSDLANVVGRPRQSPLPRFIQGDQTPAELDAEDEL